MTVAAGAGTASSPLPVGVRSLVRIAAPIALSSGMTLILGLNDTLILGRSGAGPVAAAAAATAAYSVLLGTVWGFALPAQVLTARWIGAGDPVGAARAATATAVQALGVAAGLAVVLLAVAGVVQRAVLGPGSTADLATDYLRVLAPGLVLQAVLSSLRGFVTGLGRTRVVLLATAASVAVDVGGAYAALGLGFGPLGVAVSTVLGTAAAVAVLVAHCARLSSRQPVPRPALVRGSGADLPEVRSIGVPEALQLTFGLGASVVVVVLVAPDGPVALAAVRAIDSMILVLYIVTTSVTSAVVTLAAQRIGAGDPAGVRRAESAGWRLLLLPVLGIAVAGALLTRTLTGLLVDDPRVAELAGQVAVLAWAQAPLLVAGILGNAVNRAHGDSRIGLVASLVAEYLVFLPTGVLLLRVLDTGIGGVMVAHLVYWLAYIAVILPRRRRRLAASRATAGTPGSG
jgi:multidrug resistance protein, MATE family